MIVYVVNNASYFCGETHCVCLGVFATEQEAKERMHKVIAETEEKWFDDMIVTNENQIKLTKMGNNILRLEHPTAGATETFSIQEVDFVGKLK